MGLFTSLRGGSRYSSHNCHSLHEYSCCNFYRNFASWASSWPGLRSFHRCLLGGNWWLCYSLCPFNWWSLWPYWVVTLQPHYTGLDNTGLHLLGCYGCKNKKKGFAVRALALALEEIDKHYPTASWKIINTYSSVEKATRNRGCSAYIKHPGKPPFSMSAPGGIWCRIDRAEVLALLNTTENIKLWEENPKKAVFLTCYSSTVSSTNPHVWPTWHNAEEAHREHQHPRPVKLYCSPIDTSTADQLQKQEGKRRSPYHSISITSVWH